MISETALPVFSSWSCMVSGLNFQVFSPFWISFCIQCDMVVQFGDFNCSCPVFPTPLIEEFVFPPSYFFVPCCRLIDCVWVDLFLGSFFCSTIYVSVFVPVPLCFDNYSFVIELEIKTYDAFFVLPQDCFGYLKSFMVPYTFWNHFLCFSEKKMSLDFDRDCFESVHCFGLYGYFNSINSTSSCASDSFPFVCIVFNVLLQCLTVFTVQVFYFLVYIYS